jgi:sugar O-acyltransferase (sialic acid O-acetyltransferase NeuD family)
MRFLIIGAGGFSSEVADLILSLGHKIAGYFDEHVQEGPGYGPDDPPILSRIGDVDFDAIAIAIGDTAARKSFYEMFFNTYPIPTLIHPSACVSWSAQIDAGTLVMQNVVVNAHAHVGACCILNVGCCVAHDCSVGAYTHLAPLVQLAGGSSVGEGTFCGTGSMVLPSRTVGAWATCGAGAVVTTDVASGVTVAGTPARPLLTGKSADE